MEDSLALLEEESDEEMREMAKEELSDAKESASRSWSMQLKILLLPKDPNDDKNVIVEIRAGAGGDEAALFAAELYRMYVQLCRAASAGRWSCISVNENGIGGFKEVVAHGHRPGRIFQAEIRERRTPGTACAGD